MTREHTADPDTSPRIRNLRPHNSYRPARGAFPRPVLTGKYTQETDHISRCRVRHARLPASLVAPNPGLRLPRARFRRQHSGKDPRD